MLSRGVIDLFWSFVSGLTAPGIASQIDEGVGAGSSMSLSGIVFDISAPLTGTVTRMASPQELVRLALKLAREMARGEELPGELRADSGKETGSGLS